MTPTHRCRVIQTEHLEESMARWLGQRVELVQCSSDDEDFTSQVNTAHGLVIRTYTQVNETLLRQAPNLKVIGRAGVGVDNIDVSACAQRGITVCNTPAANVEAVVEYVFAQLFDLLRPRVNLRQAVTAADWNHLRAQYVGKREVSELTLGILGLGRNGKRLAEVGRILGMTVLYFDIVEIEPVLRFGAQPVESMNDLFEHSDIVSIHVDGRPENHDLVGAEQFRRLRSDAIVMNTSRGFVVDSSALAFHLRANPQAHAVLDVHDPEPFTSDYPLIGVPNVILSPHIASRTQSAMRRMSEVVYDVWAVLSGEQPRHPVLM